ncbi:MAG TPA: phosphoribosylanthranilate isomerase [Chloroflexi bacterium]|nr:phosphoribosylanthranilate isomerase [Chloroflexota bacterium]
MIHVKICGITNVADARCAARAGADFLGFVFYPRSARCVTPGQVAAITGAIREAFGPDAPRFVGVFVNEPAAEVARVLDAAGLDLAQLHGDESPDEVRSLVGRAFKAIRPRSPDETGALADLYAGVAPQDDALPHLLLDAYHTRQFGGTGLQADFVSARSLARRLRLILAGGLTPETVGEAIEQVQPWGVDVSSGVERAKGLKDHERVRAFVRNARAVNRNGVRERESKT